MKDFSFTRLRLKNALWILLGVTLVFGIFLENQQELSWAAPNQNPDQQTIPPRPPTLTPTPSPQPPAPAPTPTLEPPPPSEDNNDDDEDDETSPSTPSPEPAGENSLPPPSQTPEPEGDTGSDQIPSIHSLGLAENEDQNGSSIESAELEDSKDGVPAFSQQADLGLSKIADNTAPNMGESVTFTIVVSNSGPSNANNVIVGDSLPAGLRLSLATQSQGKFSSDTGIWTINTIALGRSVTLTLVGVVVNDGIITNTAEVITALQADPDSTPGNGLEEEDDQDSAQIVVSSEISAITQSGSDSTIVASTAGSGSELLTLTENTGLLYWLYALILGITLVLSGLFLVSRA